MLIMAILPSTLILYLSAVLVWVRRVWNGSADPKSWQMRGANAIRQLHHIIPEVSKTTVHEAVTEILGYRKLCARWVPKILTDNHKTKWMCSALKFLTRYAQEGDEFLDSNVTGDETWVFHHTPESKQSPFALRNHMTECTSHLAGFWNSAAISNMSHSHTAGSTTVKRARLTGKGSRLMAVLP